MIFDLHCDTIREVYRTKKCGKPFCFERSFLQVDEEKLKAGGYVAQCFAAFVPATEKDPYALLNELIDVYDETVALSTVSLTL